MHNICIFILILVSKKKVRYIINIIIIIYIHIHIKQNKIKNISLSNICVFIKFYFFNLLCKNPISSNSLKVKVNPVIIQANCSMKYYFEY